MGLRFSWAQSKMNLLKAHIHKYISYKKKEAQSERVLWTVMLDPNRPKEKYI